MLPATTSRLLNEDGVGALTPENRHLVVARLLEEGDKDDLAWLFAALGEAAVADWLGERGGRQLSSRSRRFWSVLLDRAAAPPHDLAQELWLL